MASAWKVFVGSVRQFDYVNQLTEKYFIVNKEKA